MDRMILDEIYSVYCDRRRKLLECNTIEIREDLYAELFEAINKDIGHCSLGEPNKLFGMEIKALLSADEDLRFVISD